MTTDGYPINIIGYPHDPDAPKAATPAEIGTCDLCGQELLRSPDSGDVWHPWTVERACPPEPSWDEPGGVAAWQEFYRKWPGTGRPGAEHFVKDAS